MDFLYPTRGEGLGCSSAPPPYSMGDLHPVGERAMIFRNFLACPPPLHPPSLPLLADGFSKCFPFFFQAYSSAVPWSPFSFFWGGGVVGSAPAFSTLPHFRTRWSIHSHPVHSASLGSLSFWGFMLWHSLALQYCLVLDFFHQISHIPPLSFSGSHRRSSRVAVLHPQLL